MKNTGPRYVIHIGMPKTGTKYLQKCFTSKKHEMMERGIYYPTEFWKPNPIFGHHQVFTDLVNGVDLRDTFARINATPASVVLLSCEGFQGLPPQHLETLMQLTGNAPTKIIVSLRRWSDWIPSQWQQSVKQGSIKTFYQYFSELLAAARGQAGVNNKIILDRFEKVFGKGAVGIMPYSSIQDGGRDLFAEFANEVLGWNVESAKAPKIVHKSMDIYSTELTRCLNVIETKCGGSPGIRIATALSRAANNEAVRHIYAAMKPYVGTVDIDDRATPLLPIFAELQAEYGDRLLCKRCGSQIFERRTRTFEYVRQDFMTTPGMSAAINRVHTAITPSLNV